MPSLTVRGPGGPSICYSLADEAVTIGRSAGNALVLLDRMVSSTHARLWKEADGEWMIEDLDSRNGTRVNGARLTGRRRLAPDDEIALGQMVVVFESSARDGVNETPLAEDLLAWSARGGVMTADPVLVGESAVMRELRAEIERVAAADVTTLICGETGTGKELVARLLHCRSSRRGEPFVVVNCPALPASLIEAELFGVERGVATGVERRTGRLETADGGTLFLDEVGDLDLSAQAKLLRFLEDRVVEPLGGRKPVQVDVRIVAATNRDFEKAVEEGKFRRDLYHRLDVYRIDLPPLRERPDDVPLLVEHFLAASGGGRLSPDVARALGDHPFPGNVRQLRHAIERARVAAAGGEILERHLPREFLRARQASEPAGDVVRELRERVVERGESFWTVFREPFLRRELERGDALKFVEWAYEEAGHSYREMANLFHIPDQYRKLENFLYHHRLKVTTPPRRGGAR